MVPYSAMLDASRYVIQFLARSLAAHRQATRTPKGSRALGPFHQALSTLRWFREARSVHRLAHDAHISQATSYRHLHEAINIFAQHAPDLH